MKKVVITSVMAAMFSMGAAQAGDDLTSLTNEGRALAKQFLGTLKPELKKAMKAGGPVHALDVCHVKAPQIAQSVSQRSGWDVKRVSLKPRNPNAEPDAFERKVLAEFEAKKAHGANPKKLEHAEKVTENGHTVFRYMKAIPTGGICLTCHGEQLAPPVAKKIHELYPNDKATGYKAGDIRGAFSFKKVLQ
jgi:hypothetical protein